MPPKQHNEGVWLASDKLAPASSLHNVPSASYAAFFQANNLGETAPLPSTSTAAHPHGFVSLNNTRYGDAEHPLIHTLYDRPVDVTSNLTYWSTAMSLPVGQHLTSRQDRTPATHHVPVGSGRAQQEIEQIEQDEEELQDARDRLLGLRFKLKAQRGELRKVRHKAGEEEGVLLRHLRQLLRNLDVDLPKEMEESLTRLENVRDEHGVVEDKYDEAEDQYNQREWDFTQKEAAFVEGIIDKGTITTPKVKEQENSANILDSTRHAVGSDIVKSSYELQHEPDGRMIGPYLDSLVKEIPIEQIPHAHLPQSHVLAQESPAHIATQQTYSNLGGKFDPPSPEQASFSSEAPFSLQDDATFKGSRYATLSNLTQYFDQPSSLAPATEHSPSLVRNVSTPEPSLSADKKRQIDKWLLETLFCSSLEQSRLKLLMPPNSLQEVDWKKLIEEHWECDTVITEHRLPAIDDSVASRASYSAPTSFEGSSVSSRRDEAITPQKPIRTPMPVERERASQILPVMIPAIIIPEDRDEQLLMGLQDLESRKPRRDSPFSSDQAHSPASNKDEHEAERVPGYDRAKTKETFLMDDSTTTIQKALATVGTLKASEDHPLPAKAVDDDYIAAEPAAPISRMWLALPKTSSKAIFNAHDTSPTLNSRRSKNASRSSAQNSELWVVKPPKNKVPYPELLKAQTHYEKKLARKPLRSHSSCSAKVRNMYSVSVIGDPQRSRSARRSI